MKKLFLFLLLAIVVTGCSPDDELQRVQCNCTETIQFTFIENGNSTPGDTEVNNIENPDCNANGQVTVVDTPFNGGILRKTTTINCE